LTGTDEWPPGRAAGNRQVKSSFFGYYPWKLKLLNMRGAVQKSHNGFTSSQKL